MSEAGSGQGLTGLRKVTILCPHMDIGGFSSYTLSCYKVLKELGLEVDVFVAEPFGRLKSVFDKEIPAWKSMRRGLESREGYIARLASLLNSSGTDCVIINNLPAANGALPLLRPEILRIAVVHNVTGLEIDTALWNRKYLDLVAPVAKNIEIEILKQEKDVPVKVYPVGISPVETSAKTQTSTKLQLLFLGRLAEQKDPLALAEIARLLEAKGVDFLLTVVGDGPVRPALEARISELGLTSKFKIVGAVAPSAVGAYFDAADVFLLTSLFEGTPHALLEAMAHGAISLATRIEGSTTEIITHKSDGFILEHGDWEAFAELILQISRSRADYEGIRTTAQQTIRNRYSAKGLLNNMLHVTVASSPARKRRSQGAARELIPASVAPKFPGLFGQLKHRVGDLLLRR